MSSYPSTTTTNQGQVKAVEAKPSPWFAQINAEKKALTEQR